MNPFVLLGAGLVLMGLGVPQLVDAIEMAYGLDIPRDFGVLPWLALVIAGTGLIIFYLLPKRRKQARTKLDRTERRATLIWSALAVVAFLEIPPFIWADVTAVLKAANIVVFYKALTGLWLISLAVGALVFAGFWFISAKHQG
jgi:hypothetical protein